MNTAARTESLRKLIAPRVVELSYTSWDLQAFAQDNGYSGPPFRWDEGRRFLLRCELDACFFHLYLSGGKIDYPFSAEGEMDQDMARLKTSFPTPRDAASYIIDTFLILRRKDEEKFGTYRTKDTILEVYDALAIAMKTGKPYRTRLNPPPADPACRHPRLKCGILAYGSLISDPGDEIGPNIKMRLKTLTSFPVEYGRYSGKTRGGAPTVVKHDKGAPVEAEILVLDDAVTIEEARDMLWRRERRKVGSGETYVEGATRDSVLVRETKDNPCVSSVLYTDFLPIGKETAPTAADLAAHAIDSVKKAEPGMDGISYLIACLKAGIKTPLTDAYREAILQGTGTESLEAALDAAQDRGQR